MTEKEAIYKTARQVKEYCPFCGRLLKMYPGGGVCRECYSERKHEGCWAEKWRGWKKVVEE